MSFLVLVRFVEWLSPRQNRAAAVAQEEPVCYNDPHIRLEIIYMARKFTQADIDNFVSKYRSGKAPAEIAQDAGVWLRSVYRWLAQAGISVPNSPTQPRRIYTADEIGRIVDQYLSGATFTELAEVGVSMSCISRWLKKRGIAARGHRLQLADAEIVSLYAEGLSEKAISDRIGVARNAVRARLIEADVITRGRSAAERLKWSRMTDTDRRAQVVAAHAATLGREVPFAERVLRAKTHEKRINHVGRHEAELAGLINQSGLIARQQFQVANYNLDIGIEEGRVAVEVCGSGFNAKRGSCLPKRTEYLLNRSWGVLFVSIRHGVSANLGAIAQNIIAHAQLRSRTGAIRGEYGVIGRHGENRPRPRRYLDDWPYVI